MFNFKAKVGYDELVFEFPVKDDSEADMWLDPTMNGYKTGEQVPCTFLGTVTENEDFWCYFEEGSSNGLTRSIKIHVIGFTVGANAMA